MNRPFFSLATLLPLLTACSLLNQCARSQLFPDYTPLCAGRTPAEGLASPDEARSARRIYHVGPKGGVYYINERQKKIYVTSRKQR